MVAILAYSVLVFYAMRLGVVLVNLMSDIYLTDSGVESTKTVSVLIPARNEEANIGNLLQSLVLQNHRQLEIWVYDDHSEDATAQIVQKYAQEDSRIHLILGQALPEGWLGKNHACHQLSKHAMGHYLLFVDADVELRPHAISSAIRSAEKHRTALLSVFPQQIMHTPGEKLSVPLMNWILLSLLPLAAVRWFSFPSLAAANGQFMFFRKENYEALHARMRNNPVEDIAIIQYLKSQGHKTGVWLGHGDIYCRMYLSFDDAAKGFAKNILAFFGHSKLVAMLFAVYSTFGFVAVGYTWGAMAGVGILLAAWFIRILVSLISGQPAGYTALWAPVIHMAYLVILFKRIFRKEKLIWKGRTI